MKIILNTERLYLREFTIEDVQNFIDLNSNPNVIRYTGDDVIETKEKATELLTNIVLPQYKCKLGRWAVHLKSNDEFIGWCGLKYLEEDKMIDLGYRFFEKHWGKGYATESAKAVLEYGFNTLNLSEIVAHAAIDNINSHKVLKKAGMQFEKEGVERCGKIYQYRLSKAQFKTS